MNKDCCALLFRLTGFQEQLDPYGVWTGVRMSGYLSSLSANGLWLRERKALPESEGRRGRQRRQSRS